MCHEVPAPDRGEREADGHDQPTRGPKPGLTPDDVVQAAIAIADEQGLGALRMQAVSAKLGLTTMAVYRYFPSKEALVDAIVDAGMGLPARPPDPREDCRAEVARWAHAKRAMLIARPWLAELPFVAAPHGPNPLSWLEALAELDGIELYVKSATAPSGRRARVAKSSRRTMP